MSLSMCMNGSSTWLLHSARVGPYVPCFFHSWCEQLSGVGCPAGCASHSGSAEQLVAWKVELA